MDKTIDFSSLKSAITADKIIDLARKHNDSETLNETLRRKGDSNISSLGIPDEPSFNRSLEMSDELFFIKVWLYGFYYLLLRPKEMNSSII